MRKNYSYLAENPRHPKGFMSSVAPNILHLRNPWVTAWWSAAIPGFGHIILGIYIKGFFLVIWEIFVNLQAHINEAILYSFTGRFEQAVMVFNPRWGYLYTIIYIYAIWDSCRLTIDLNKHSLLADRNKSPVQPFKISSMGINYLDKRIPWLPFAWSALVPGLGHLCTNRLPIGIFILSWWMAAAYFSNLYTAFLLSVTGHFSRATAATNPAWLLFIPSLYVFSIYDSYNNAVEYNKLFEAEQSMYLKSNYQSPGFRMPVPQNTSSA